MAKEKEERLKEIRSAIINADIDEDTTKIILEFVNDRYKTQFEEASDEVLEIFVFVLQELRLAIAKHSIYVNEMAAAAIRQHILLGNWSQLKQIHRSLPDEILNTRKSELIAKLIDPVVKLDRDFTDLPYEDKKKIMKGVEKS